MFVYILRRLSQTALVLAITSVLVFGGLYLVGDPVEILVNPSADQIEKERAAAALGLPPGVSRDVLARLAAAGRLHELFKAGHAAAGDVVDA